VNKQARGRITEVREEQTLFRYILRNGHMEKQTCGHGEQTLETV
jgi:hypothetical protein